MRRLIVPLIASAAVLISSVLVTGATAPKKDNQQCQISGKSGMLLSTVEKKKTAKKKTTKKKTAKKKPTKTG